MLSGVERVSMDGFAILADCSHPQGGILEDGS